MALRLILLNRDNASHVEALQAVFEACPSYHLNTGGAPASISEASDTLSALPANFSRANKFTFGIELAGNFIGCVDLLRGYPAPQQAMLGLLLLREDSQGSGRGREAFGEVEKLARTWPEIATLRIGVVEANGGVLAFWQKMGFLDTGVRRPFENGPIFSTTIILEKYL